MGRWILLVPILFIFSGCLTWVTSNEMVIEKPKMESFARVTKRNVRSEEKYILTKPLEKWAKKELDLYVFSVNENNQLLKAMGVLKGLKGKELTDYIKNARSRVEVVKRLIEVRRYLLKKKKEEKKKRKRRINNERKR